MSLPKELEDLPHLGVGASLSFGVEPDPVALARQKGGPSFIEYAGAVDHTYLAGPIQALQKQGTPLLYHPSCLNLCGPDKNPATWIRAVDHHVKAVGSHWLAQDVAVCFVGDTPGYSIQLGYFIPPILTQAGLDEAVERVLEVTELVEAPLLLEPAPVTFQLGDMNVFSWLNALAERTQSGILLDAGHIVSHQMALYRPELLAGLDEIDFDRVIEVHVAGGVIHKRDGHDYYIDAHDLPILPETWQVFYHILERAKNLRAVCVECEGTIAHAVHDVLKQTRDRVVARSVSTKLVQKVEKELTS